MITEKTARAIAYAYREIEVAEALLAKIEDALSRQELPDIRDAFGRPRGGLQLGVPSGESSTRLFDVSWTLAKPVIEAHIAHHRSVLAALSEKARAEADARA